MVLTKGTMAAGQETGKARGEEEREDSESKYASIVIRRLAAALLPCLRLKRFVSQPHASFCTRFWYISSGSFYHRF